MTSWFNHQKFQRSVHFWDHTDSTGNRRTMPLTVMLCATWFVASQLGCIIQWRMGLCKTQHLRDGRMPPDASCRAESAVCWLWLCRTLISKTRTPWSVWKAAWSLSRDCWIKLILMHFHRLRLLGIGVSFAGWSAGRMTWRSSKVKRHLVPAKSVYGYLMPIAAVFRTAHIIQTRRSKARSLAKH